MPKAKKKSGLSIMKKTNQNARSDKIKPLR